METAWYLVHSKPMCITLNYYPGKRLEVGISRKLGRTGKEFEVVEPSVSWNLKFLLGRTDELREGKTCPGCGGWWCEVHIMT